MTRQDIIFTMDQVDFRAVGGACVLVGSHGRSRSHALQLRHGSHRDGVVVI